MQKKSEKELKKQITGAKIHRQMPYLQRAFEKDTFIDINNGQAYGF